MLRKDTKGRLWRVSTTGLKVKWTFPSLCVSCSAGHIGVALSLLESYEMHAFSASSSPFFAHSLSSELQL